MDLKAIPEFRSHVSLARKIFTKSFVLSQKQKSNNWLKDAARGTDLDIDDDMFESVNEDGLGNDYFGTVPHLH